MTVMYSKWAILEIILNDCKIEHFALLSLNTAAMWYLEIMKQKNHLNLYNLAD